MNILQSWFVHLQCKRRWLIISACFPHRKRQEASWYPPLVEIFTSYTASLAKSQMMQLILKGNFSFHIIFQGKFLSFITSTFSPVYAGIQRIAASHSFHMMYAAKNMHYVYVCAGVMRSSKNCTGRQNMFEGWSWWNRACLLLLSIYIAYSMWTTSNMHVRRQAMILFQGYFSSMPYEGDYLFALLTCLILILLIRDLEVSTYISKN